MEIVGRKNQGSGSFTGARDRYLWLTEQSLVLRFEDSPNVAVAAGELRDKRPQSSQLIGAAQGGISVNTEGPRGFIFVANVVGVQTAINLAASRLEHVITFRNPFNAFAFGFPLFSPESSAGHLGGGDFRCTYWS